MKRWMPVLCIALLATSLSGASAWEGSAMMSAYGEFPDSGYYAACNSFPRNTAVEVVNLENGKSVTVIVTKGLENPGIFLLLSPEAAKALSMEPGSLSRVRVSAPRNIAETPPAGSGPGVDPDFNPSLLASRAGVSAPPEESRSTIPVEVPAVAAEPGAPGTAPEEPAVPEPVPSNLAPPPTAVVNAEVSPKAPTEPPEVSAPSEAPEPALPTAPVPGSPSAKEAPVVRPELIARSGVAPLESKPVTAVLPAPEAAAIREVPEDKAVVHGLNRPAPAALPVEAALADPVLVPDELPDTALTRKAWPADPAPSVALADLEIRMDDSGKPEALSRNQTGSPDSDRAPEVGLAEPIAVAKTEPEKRPEPSPVIPPADSVPAEPADVVVTMEPAAPKPPEAPTKPTAAPAAPVAAAPVPVRPSSPPKEPAPAPDSTSLIPGRHYIQVGAFKTTAAVETAAARLRGAFPVTIDTVTTGPGPLYRLFVGPLGRDETGVALLQVRSLGFKEAFLKN